ncbi:hypothetical protein OS493_015740 [Desmophyllum pertusum]|uniref:Uncharacterized protein n=1 Tax=Desmophyllum pertusum TaxID=174260 RepID=A0A9W9YPB3_9CNID|nr:hypothetical protein OS493_015740 [Desmophyllum pertusum]
MNGLMLLSASTFIYFTYHILDQGFCEAAEAGLQRDPSKKLTYALFKDHYFHVLDVPKVEGVTVQTWKHCLLRCVKNDQCFSTNIAAFPLPNGNLSCELLPTDKYSASEKFKANHTFHHYSIVGINVDSGYAAKARLGIVSDDVVADFCADGCDAFIAFGGPSRACGNKAFWETDNGDKDIRAMCYILIH